MKEMHIILLEQSIGENIGGDVTVYIGRFKSKNECLLKMHLQGVLPVYKVLTHTTVNSKKALPAMIFPSLGIIEKQFGKVSIRTLFSYFIGRPVKKIFRGSTRKQWQQLGEYDTLTKRVYPIPDEIETESRQGVQT